MIVGFNTFLPPGYKIEVSDEHHGYIQVTHPSSRTESIAIGGHSGMTYNLSITTPTATYRQTANILSHDCEEMELGQTPTTTINITTTATTTTTTSIATTTSTITTPTATALTQSTSQAVHALISAANAPSMPIFSTTGSLNLSAKSNKQTTTSTVGAPSTPTGSSTPTPSNDKTSSGQPVEFNHAINYVNKIKNRFHQYE